MTSKLKIRGPSSAKADDLKIGPLKFSQVQLSVTGIIFLCSENFSSAITGDWRDETMPFIDGQKRLKRDSDAEYKEKRIAHFGGFTKSPGSAIMRAVFESCLKMVHGAHSTHKKNSLKSIFRMG